MKNYIFNDKYADGVYHIDLGRASLSEGFHMHTHNLNELVYITEGSGVHRVDSEEYDTGPGDVFVISDRTGHGFTNCENLNMYNLVYPSSVLNNVLVDIKELAGYHMLFTLGEDRPEKKYSQYIRLNPSGQKQANLLFGKIRELQERKPAGYRTLIYSAFLELIHFLSLAREAAAGKSPAGLPLASMLAFIEQNYSRKITCGDISLKCGFTSRHINRIFKNELGMTPVEYITEIRLKKALDLIIQTNLTITHIAYECGFSDSNYFIKRFKNKYGYTPGTLRL